jgi:outer membrane protein
MKSNLMPKWIRTTAILAAAALAAPGLRAQEKMTLQQFIDTAVKNSASVQIAGEAVTGAEERIREAKSFLLPQVGFASSYTRLSLVQEFDIPDFGHFKFSTPNTYSFRLGATQPLFTWGRLGKTVEMSRVGRDIADSGVTLTEQTLGYQIVPIFFGVLYTDEAVKVLDSTLEALHKKLAIIQERYKAGLASDFDVSLLNVQIGGLESQRLDFLNNVRKLMMTYNRIAGRPVESTFTPEATLELQPVQADTQALAAEAAANRPEARLIENQRRLAQTQIDLARTADKPNVVASFNYQFNNGYLPNVSQIRGYWTATLAVSYSVFDGRRTSAQVAEARVGLRTVEAQAADLRRGFMLEIDQALADLKTLEQRIAVEKTKIEHAEKALRIADERYRSGLMSMTDLVDAQDSLDTARLNYLQLVYNHILARYSLDKAAGRTITS